ncbi:hypothetical protein BV25DRAFT_1955777 [Artomyces pyxidatus]|uniref:Uncharacterized protein n=1 Tax=Artomyces pyxidatus TaxID=48021 RepID=A0ACB8SW86_9AGAM|nr:hypothetical protein BV25DRAFT_1955777 [Artomyces pyxidatus]
MPLRPSYGPTGETSEEILFEKTFLISGYLTALGYGIQLVLYAQCVRILCRTSPLSRNALFLISYITVLCAMNTVWTGTSAYSLQATFIDNRNYPGGPYGFLLVEFSLPFNVVCLASYIIGNVMADALLLWRCRVIWRASAGENADLVMIVPVLTIFASLATGIIYAIDTSSPVGFFGRITINMGTVFFAISLSLNIMLTLMIVVRLWSYQRKSRDVFGPRFGRKYTSFSTMFIESAAMYAICSVLLLVTYSIGHPINQIFLGLSPSVQMIANYLIIYRVAQGRAWTEDTITNPDANISFSSFHRRTDHMSHLSTNKSPRISHLGGLTVVTTPLHDWKRNAVSTGSRMDVGAHGLDEGAFAQAVAYYTSSIAEGNLDNYIVCGRDTLVILGERKDALQESLAALAHADCEG